MQRHATLLFHGGPVLTMDRRHPESDALAVVGNRIAALGAEARALQGSETRVVDLQGRALIPGFVDAHNHLVNYGVRLMRLDLSGLQDAHELLEMVKARAGMTPGDGWIVGHSWDETRWRDATLPTRAELDAAAGGRRCILARVDRHAGLATTRALEAAGAPAPGESAFVVEEDYYKVLDLAKPSFQTQVRGVGAASRRCHELGITSSHVICHGDDFGALQAARDQRMLGVRVSCFVGEESLDHAIALGARRGLGDAWVRFQGLKLYSDGSFGSRTAAVSFPYLDAQPETRGTFMHAEGRLEALVRRARQQGLQIAVHAIGDRAARRVLDAFELAGVAPAERARIEHLELAEDADLDRAAAMGVIASVQPNFTGEWGHKGGMYEKRLGWDRARRLNRFALYGRKGLPLAFGSDDMPLGPLYGIASAVQAPEPDQRVDVMAALHAYTAGAAWAAFAENEAGTLSPGMLADLVVLSADPRQAADPARLQVDMTILDGQTVYQRA